MTGRRDTGASMVLSATMRPRTSANPGAVKAMERGVPTRRRIGRPRRHQTSARPTAVKSHAAARGSRVQPSSKITPPAAIRAKAISPSAQAPPIATWPRAQNAAAICPTEKTIPAASWPAASIPTAMGPSATTPSAIGPTAMMPRATRAPPVNRSTPQVTWMSGRPKTCWRDRYSHPT